MGSLAKRKAKTESTTAIGVSEFKKLLEQSTIFIDKTLLIKDFLQSPAQVLLITCPRRWGKSINMDMIKTFLEIEVNERGEKYQDKKSTSNYQLFNQGVIASDGTNTVCLEAPLRILQHSNIMKQYQGKYPVISVDFKNVKGTDYEDILAKVKLAIRCSFKQHEYMLNVLDKILKNEQSTFLEQITAQDYLLSFEKIYNNNAQEATKLDIENSLKFLSELLHEYFKVPVYVLMDEYDTPIKNILENAEFSSEDLDKTLLLFRALMGSTFKGNKHLAKGLITGVFRISTASLFSDLNNIQEYNFINNVFAKHYGFSQDEITNLFNEYNISPELSQQAKEWYNGYRVSIDSNLLIYNPWSIVNFINSEMIKNYWEETGNINFIEKLLKVDDIKTKIQTLINKEVVLIDLNGLKFNKDDFLTLKTLINQNIYSSANTKAVNLLFSYIFAAGYLTISMIKNDPSYFYVRLPNGEVTAELSKKLKSYYQQLYNIPLKLFSDATKALEELFKSGIYERFQQVLENIFSCIKFTKITDTEQSGAHPNEDLFHSIVNIIAIQSSYTKFGTEVYNTGIQRGRTDIVLVNNDCKLGMIIEIKCNQTEMDPLAQAKQYKPIFKGYDQMQYVTINVTSDSKVTVVTDLEDHQDYNQSANGTND